MRWRPVVLVLLILACFYYLTTRFMPTGALAGLFHHADPDGVMTSTVHGPLGDFSLTEASAAPAFDTEEQQNIAVYKRARCLQW